jgi:putative ABC transport system permease protein
MFLRLVADSFSRRPRHKLLTGAALALGMAVATAALSVSLDVGDHLAHEFRSLGANLIITPHADSLPLEIGGVDYRPANAGAYLPESDLPKIKTVFWHNNIIAFAPTLEISVAADNSRQSPYLRGDFKPDVRLIGTWAKHTMTLSNGSTFETGIANTNPWWHVEGKWFDDSAAECLVGSSLAKRKDLKVGEELSVFEVEALDPPLHVNAEPIRKVLKEKIPDEVLNTPGLQILPKDFDAVQHGLTHKLRVSGIVSTGGPEDEAIVTPLAFAQRLAKESGEYSKLYVSALTKPEDDFARRNPATMNPDEFERWSCTPYVSSIARSIQEVLPGSDVRVIRRVAEGEGRVLTRVRTLLWLITFAALLAAGLAVGASSAASVIERRTEIGLMKALGAGSAAVGFLLAAEQLLLAFTGGAIGYAFGILLARLVGQHIFGTAPSPSILVLLVILLLAGVVTLLGSAVPLRRAARYQPAAILRGE